MIKVKKIKPMFDSIVTTAEQYESDEIVNGVSLPLKGTVKEIQKVLFVGPAVKDVKEGDLVKLDLTRYNKMVHEQVQKSREERFCEKDTTDKATIVCDVPTDEIDGQTVFLLTERDIRYVLLEHEEAKSPDIKLIKNRILTV